MIFNLFLAWAFHLCSFTLSLFQLYSAKTATRLTRFPRIALYRAAVAQVHGRLGGDNHPQSVAVLRVRDVGALVRNLSVHLATDVVQH